ncbi:MAG: hypothetical protein R6V06_00085 [Kiritimatiellia bacterium]
MSESTLSTTYTDLMNAVRVFLGYASDDSVNDKEVNLYVQSGMRQFYYPDAVEGVDPGFEWSFLKPTTTLDTVADTAAYVLPDTLGRVIGCFHFEPNIHIRPISVVSEAMVLSKQQGSLIAGVPVIACIRHTDSTGASGQRQEAVFWPTPGAAYTLTYRFEAYANKLSEDNPYPLGGMKHSELLLESCLAIAEQRANDEAGVHTEKFHRMLITATKRDLKNGAVYYGNMGQPDSDGEYLRQHSSGVITYKGMTL